MKSGDTMIVLVGHRGSGKTTIGRLLAERLGLEFIDVDHRIQTTSKRTIAALFSEGGEALFRQFEHQAIADLEPTTPAVISVGAGAVEDVTNRTRLQALGRVVWLQAAADVRGKRMDADPGHADNRPALAASATDLRRREALRDALYADLATLQINTDEASADVVCNRLIEALGAGEHR